MAGSRKLAQVAGSKTFSTKAADVLVRAYLAQPEGQRDLRRVLAEAKQGSVTTGWVESMDPKDITWNPGVPPPTPKPEQVDPSVIAEIAGMSKSQAYELLRQDPRYQPTTQEQAEELSQRTLDMAREILDHEQAKKPYQRDISRMKAAQSLIGTVEWHRNRAQRVLEKAERRGSGLAGLVA